MEVYIKSSEKLHFDPVGSNNAVANSSLTKMWFSHASSKYCKRYVSLLKESLTQKFELKRPRLSELLNWKVLLELFTGKKTNMVRALLTTETEIGKECLMHQLTTVLGGLKNFQVGLLLGSGSLSKTKFGTESTTLSYVSTLVRGSDNFYGFKTTLRQKVIYEALVGQQPINGLDLTVRILISDEGLENLRMNYLESPLSVNHQLLSQEEFMDTDIIIGSGERIKCHKVFLTVNSNVFRAMFQNSMTEGATGILKLFDISGPGVRALLQYLYTRELTGALRDSLISVELLVSAEKYDIMRLEVDTRDLILSKNNSWFTVSSALQLLHFAKVKVATVASDRNASYKILEEKAVEVLKSKPTEELIASKEYRELFDDPATGMEFCSYMMSKTQNTIKSDYFEN